MEVARMGVAKALAARVVKSTYERSYLMLESGIILTIRIGHTHTYRRMPQNPRA
jgi:hypothetical protein